jgi:hypothetical protein
VALKGVAFFPGLFLGDAGCFLMDKMPYWIKIFQEGRKLGQREGKRAKKRKMVKNQSISFNPFDLIPNP